MLLDSFAEFSNSQAVTATAISDVMDLGATNTLKNIAAGADMWLIVRTVVAATDTGSDATLTLSLESDSAATLASAPVVHYTTGALAFATYSAAGSLIAAIRLPAASYKRYLGVRYTIASGPLTAGQFDAFLVDDYGDFRSYADNSAISSGA